MATESWPGPEGEPSGSSVPDHVWDRFLRDTEKDIEASAPKELSARARVAARRIREEKERAATAEAQRLPRLPSRPVRPERRESIAADAIAAERAGRGSDGSDRRANRGRRPHTALAVLLVLAMVVIALSPSRAWSIVTGRGWGDSVSVLPAPTATLGPETSQPTAPPDSAGDQNPTLGRPFAGSPAEAWADGAAAIVPPAATAYSAVSENRMADGLRLLKKFLVATSLDPAVVAGGAGTAVELIDAHGNDARSRVLSGLTHPTAADDPAALFSRFGPEVRLAGSVVKVRGRMSVDKGSTYGGAQITADYTFVYALRKASDGTAAPEITRTVVRRTVTVELSADDQRPSAPGTLVLSGWSSLLANSGCGVHDGLLHPYFADGRTAPGGPLVTRTPSGPAYDPYDRSRPLNAGGGEPGCVTTSRI